MDKIIKEEIDKGHSFYMIVTDHPEFNITERTLYYYQEKCYLSCKNIDLPRIVRYRKSKRKVSKNKSERKENECRINPLIKTFLTIKQLTTSIIMQKWTLCFIHFKLYDSL